MDNIVFAGTMENDCLRYLAADRHLFSGLPCYELNENHNGGIYARKLNPKLRDVGTKEALEGADRIITFGNISPKMSDLLKGKETSSAVEYVKRRIYPIGKLPSFTIHVGDGWIPDALTQISKFEPTGYQFYLYSNRPDWDEALAFSRFRSRDASFAICLDDGEGQNVTSRFLKGDILRFARKQVPVLEYATQMLCWYPKWRENMHFMPGRGENLLFFGSSRRAIRLSETQLGILHALEDGSVEGLGSYPPRVLEQFTAMCRQEEWKSSYFAALIRTHAVCIENYNDIIISYIGSRRCNMKCSYCFSDHRCEALSAMSGSDAVRAADMLLADRSEPNVHFDNNLGGEPLLNWEAVRKLHNTLIAYHKTRGIRASFGLLTNGTQLGAKHLEWLRHHIPYVGFSLDGDRPTHDAIRRDATGDPTYDRAVEGIRLLQESEWPVECGVSTVISRYNLDIAALQSHIREELRVSNVVMKPVRAAASEDFSLTCDDLADLEKGYREFFDNLLEEGRKNNLEPLFTMLQPLDYAGRFFLRVFLADRVVVKRCGSGEHIFSVADDATVYPCDSFNGIPKYEIANLQEGKHNRPVYCVPFVTEEKEAFGCSHCWARYLCGGICQYVQYLNNYQHNNVTQLECGLAKFLIEAAILFWEEAYRTWEPEMLEEVRKQVHKIGFREMEDPDSFIYAPC